MQYGMMRKPPRGGLVVKGLASVTLKGVRSQVQFLLDNTPYHANKEDKQCEKDRCELLGTPSPYQEPPICKIRKFEVIKYSFGPGEKYIAIKEREHDDWTTTKEDACHAYQEIFRIMDEGWTLLNENMTLVEYLYSGILCVVVMLNQDQSVETASGKLVTPSESHSDDVWKFVTSSGSAVIKVP
ncbi:hypothetical protein Tco_0953481 [Tanacetum coccineum]|uniref:Uncharacterized protein n=1 Tax=Tanacetum coccineum TaxID=301880 RepID=A0ABQ5E006_9ASTR